MLKIEYVSIDKIKPYEKNAKLHPEEQIQQIKKSIQQFGFNDPVALWHDEIVEGHGRYLAAKELGMQELPVIRLDDLTDEQRKAYMLVHNKLTMNSGFDVDLLNEELAGIFEFDMGDFGFDIEEEEEEEKNEVVEDDYDGEPPAEPKAKIGDIYKLGRHRLMCGDALNDDDVKTLLNGNVCELTFTDPPYEIGSVGGGIVGKSKHMNQIKKEKVDKFNPELLSLYSETNIYFHNKPLIKKYIELAEKNEKRYDLCFYKKESSAPDYAGHMMTDVEYIAIIGKQSPNIGLDKEMYSKCFVGNKDRDNNVSYSKPIKLCAKFICLYGKKNVLDLFGGSGSTLIACEQLHVNCFMMELNPKFVDVIISRWEKFTGKKAVKLN